MTAPEGKLKPPQTVEEGLKRLGNFWGLQYYQSVTGWKFRCHLNDWGYVQDTAMDAIREACEKEVK